MNERRAVWTCGLLMGAALCASVQAQAPERLAAYQIVGDAIPLALTTTPGDATRGRAIVTNKQLGLCLLCHTGPLTKSRSRATSRPTSVAWVYV